MVWFLLVLARSLAESLTRERAPRARSDTRARADERETAFVAAPCIAKSTGLLQPPPPAPLLLRPPPSSRRVVGGLFSCGEMRPSRGLTLPRPRYHRRESRQSPRRWSEGQSEESRR